MLEKRASNSDEIEFNRVVTGTVDNPSNAATTNSSLTPNDRKHRLLNQHSLQVWEMLIRKDQLKF